MANQWEPDEIDVYDQAVEREQIREINERNAMLRNLQAEIEQFRAAYERAKKAGA